MLWRWTEILTRGGYASIGGERDVDQELVAIIAHDELVFLRVGVRFEEEFVDMQIVDQIANEFILPEIDEVKETQGIPMDETSDRIAQGIQNLKSDFRRSDSGKRNLPHRILVRIRTLGKWAVWEGRVEDCGESCRPKTQ